MDEPRSVQSLAQSTKRVDARRVELEGKGLGTKIYLAAYTNLRVDVAGVQLAFGRAIAEMNRLDRLLSTWRADSDVGRINASAGEYVTVSPETVHIISWALWSHQISNGVFDVTFQSMAQLWKFGDAAEETPRVPTPEQVESARQNVDASLLQLDALGYRVKIGAKQQIGLGGLSKGYIVDRMALQLRDAGLDSFLVQAGGDLYAEGTKPDGSAWEAGVQDPRQVRGEAFAKIPLHNHAFSTAGDYARAFVVDGRRYHHIIDPKTGYPSTASRSVTVWAKTALLADVLDDAIFILGPRAGLELAESLDGVGAVIVGADNRLWVSERLRKRLKISRLPTDGN